MRLLNTKTGQFVWVENPRQEHYAVLSHVWAKLGNLEYPEQTYQDLLEFQKEDRPEDTLPSKLSDKLRRFCEAALKDGFELGWADTCCIDKTNSSELSEAINSMYSWYAYSGTCYAFLHDVDSPSKDSSSLNFEEPEWRASFRRSEWFKRGWTLQELIASRIVIFVSKGWEVLGSKHSLATHISSVTNIDIKVLTLENKLSLEDIPIAQRMAWMQHRKTTRLEDEAYCLMGLFGVNMQANYGEGRYAFIRLQEKILLQSTDQTILAWGSIISEESLLTLPSPSSTRSPATNHPPQSTQFKWDFDYDPINTSPPSFKHYLLASSPTHFDYNRAVELNPLPREDFRRRLSFSDTTEDLYQVFEITPYGIRTHFPLLDLQSPSQESHHPLYAGVLACENPKRGLLAILLQPRPSSSASAYEFFVGAQGITIHESGSNLKPVPHYYRLVYIPRERLASLLHTSTAATSPGPSPSQSTIPLRPTGPDSVRVVYIPHRPSRSRAAIEQDSDIYAVLSATREDFAVEFCQSSRTMLEQVGYQVSPSPTAVKSSHHILANDPSPMNENVFTVKDTRSDSNVYFTVQFGRCVCEQGKDTGALAAVVSYRDRGSLEGESLSSTPEEHLENWRHIHVSEWTLNHGAASRQIDLRYARDTARELRFKLRLVLISLAPRSSISRRYRLSVELQKFPENSTGTSVDASTAASPAVSRTNSGKDKDTGLPGSFEDTRSLAVVMKKPIEEPAVSRVREDQRAYDTGQLLHNVVLIALGAFLAFVLLLLGPYVPR